ncbi:MAG: hypothetical protein D4R97_01950 [Bacteroidetes bacterium]|nr:MAG: hypothetical protein D4R97_01950 [Bacteroidota bacterium]
MICRKFLHILAFSFFLLLLLAQTSCEKFSGDQTVPAYLRIDSIRLTTDYSTQGTAMNNITDAWVYIDGELIGTFQLPATFPVLKQGSHSLMVLPGVKKDGIAATRINYPLYQQINKTINLVADDTLDVGTLSTTYSTKTKFIWKEDFDNAAITLDTTNATTEKIKQTPSDSPFTLEGLHSGIVELDTIGATFEAVSHSTFTIPNSSVYLEMNFNVNTSLIVGVYVTTFGIINPPSPIMTLLPTNDKWKKIYIDLTTTLNAYSGATKFRVYYYVKNTSGGHYRILLDNIKVLSF